MSVPLDPTTLAKRVLRRLISEQTIGVVDYIRSPDRGTGWAPFNGQNARQALFVDIITNTQPHAIVETGTFLGDTTELMSQTGLPVFTFELNPRNYGYVRARFWRARNVKLLHGDSRTGLRRLFDGALQSLSSSTLFFYLDAHRNDDLPLAEEIDIIFSRCPLTVVMIDDFEVPSDAGYGYDDYGPGKALVSGYIRASDISVSIATLLSVHSLSCRLSIDAVGCCRLGCCRQAAPGLRCSRGGSLSSLNAASPSCHRSRTRIYALKITGRALPPSHPCLGFKQIVSSPCPQGKPQGRC